MVQFRFERLEVLVARHHVVRDPNHGTVVRVVLGQREKELATVLVCHDVEQLIDHIP